jgi:hypothetical protein
LTGQHGHQGPSTASKPASDTGLPYGHRHDQRGGLKSGSLVDLRAGDAAGGGHQGGFGGFGGLRSGFALRNYEEELGRLKKDNLQLRLRIYLLEEKHGLLPKREEKENVFRVNLDLRVENKSMKEELEEKSKLLLTAYQAIEQQEREILREREEYESRIESLRQTLTDSQYSGHSVTSGGTKRAEDVYVSLTIIVHHAAYQLIEPISSSNACFRWFIRRTSL